ncbi:MAG: YncE family protein, partial [Bacteroidota bacterium]|nr:YncE family protein [Bacteroidota bacterium]
THMIYVTRDAKEIYTTNVSSATVTLMKDTLMGPPGFPRGPGGQKQQTTPAPPPGFGPHPDWKETVIAVGKGSEGFDVSPDGKELWTAGAQDGVITIIDVPTKKVIQSIDAGALGANRLKFTPDGKMVLISSLRNGDLLVYDARSRQLIKKINIGTGAAGILVDPNGSRAFVGCTPDNYVAVVNLKTLEVSGRIDVGGGPDGLAWSDHN